MKKSVSMFIVLLFCFCLLGSILGIAFASSQNWSEVTRLTEESSGSLGVAKADFTIEHVKWRIRWEYYAAYSNPALSVFAFRVFENKSEDPIYESPYGCNGTRHFNKTGTFFIECLSSCVTYTLIIEQDLESIPEFPSWIILPLFLMATLAAIIAKKRLIHPRK